MGLYLDYWATEILLLLLAVLAFYYIRFKRTNAQYWSIRHIPHLEPRFIIGNGFAWNFKKSFGEVVAGYYNEHKSKKILGYWLLQEPTLIVFDLDLIQKLLVSDFSHFHDRFPYPGIEDEPLQGNLFNLTGQEWRNLRVKLTPTFTSGKMRMMFPTMIQCGVELHEFMKPLAENGEIVEIKDILARFNTNVIASCAFGLDTNALINPDNDFRKHGKVIFSQSSFQLALMTLAFAFPALKKPLGIKQLPQETNDFFIDAVKDTMEYRKLNDVKRNDFMQLLIELKEKGTIVDVDRAEKEADLQSEKVTDTKFTLVEAAAQAFVFFAAGFESSSTTMAFTLYELARNIEIQDKLKVEIKTALQNSGGTLTYEAITKLTYLQMVIEETLRKYPVVPLLMRQATKEYYLPDFNATLPKGQLVLIPLLGISRDPDIFQDPEKFDPLRFTTEEREKRHNFSSIPFGEGPRNCIGMRFGLLQTKIGLISLLRDYSVRCCEKTPEVLKYDPKGFIMTVEGGMHLKIIVD